MPPRQDGAQPQATMSRESFLATPLPIERELRRLFPRLDAHVVFDIGSCEGEDAIRYASLFPSATVYAVEPLASNVRLMEVNFTRHRHLNIQVLPFAMSDQAGIAPFFVSSGRPDGVAQSDWDYGNKSSSLLRPDRHLDVHPWVHFENQIEVATETLEGVCGRLGIRKIDFVHLDVQGAELSVLKGAGALLERIGAVWMEVEAIPLYEGQPLVPEVERFMSERGFRRLLSTVDAVSGDQLWVNRRIPWRGSVQSGLGAAMKWLGRGAGRAFDTIRRRANVAPTDRPIQPHRQQWR